MIATEVEIRHAKVGGIRVARHLKRSERWAEVGWPRNHKVVVAVDRIDGDVVGQRRLLVPPRKRRHAHPVWMHGRRLVGRIAVAGEYLQRTGWMPSAIVGDAS